MNSKPTASIRHHFSMIKDPRVNRQKNMNCKTFSLSRLYHAFITLCAVICGAASLPSCGADNGVSIEEFGNVKESWFTELLGLQHGIPLHDTFGDVFAAIDST